MDVLVEKMYALCLEINFEEKGNERRLNRNVGTIEKNSSYIYGN